MRVLVLDWRDIQSPEAGGAELVVDEVMRRFVTWGHEVTLVCAQFAAYRGPATEMVSGVRVIRVGAWWNAHITVPRAARALLRDEHFDVVLDDVSKLPFFGPRLAPGRTVALFHHLFGTSIFLEANPLIATGVWAYERRIGPAYRDTPAISISQDTAAELVRNGIPREKITIVPPGLDGDLYRLTGHEKDVRPLILVVSRLKKYKRVDVAIGALPGIRQILPDAHMIVVGAGARRPQLERLAARLGQPVTFAGAVSDAEKVELLNRASLVINPSAKEGWGLVGVEAFACGTPVVASDVPGHRVSVAEGAGVLVPFGDADATARAAVALLKDRELYEQHRRRGLRWARRFSWDRCAREMEVVLCRAAGTEPLAPAATPVTAEVST